MPLEPGEMSPDVLAVAPLEGYKLKLTFANGEEGVFDCSDLLDLGVFKELKDERYFRMVKPWEGTIAWPNGQDLCPDTLYLGAVGNDTNHRH